MCKRICIKKLDVGLDSSSLMPLVHTSKVLLCCRAKHISWHSMPLQSNEITTNQTQGSNLNSLNICRLYSKKQASKRHSHLLSSEHSIRCTLLCVDSLEIGLVIALLTVVSHAPLQPLQAENCNGTPPCSGGLIVRPSIKHPGVELCPGRI